MCGAIEKASTNSVLESDILENKRSHIRSMGPRVGTSLRSELILCGGFTYLCKAYSSADDHLWISSNKNDIHVNPQYMNEDIAISQPSNYVKGCPYIQSHVKNRTPLNYSMLTNLDGQWWKEVHHDSADIIHIIV